MARGLKRRLPGAAVLSLSLAVAAVFPRGTEGWTDRHFRSFALYAKKAGNMILNEANPTVDVMKLAPGALNLRDNIILDRADVEERDSNAAPIWQRLTSSVSKSSSAGVGTGTSSSGEMEMPHHFFRPSDMASFVTFPNSPHSSSAIIRHLDAVDSKVRGGISSDMPFCSVTRCSIL